LGNDTDPNDDPLTATLDIGPLVGTLVLNLDGSFVYTPAVGFTGLVTFTYIASDGELTDTATVDIAVGNYADVGVSKVVDDLTPAEGDTIIYTLQVTNNGPAVASGVVISDTLPDGVSYVSDDGGGAYDEITGVWDVGGLGVDSSATLHITATVDLGTRGTAIVNTAVISSSDQPDPISGNDADSATITVLSPTDADLAVGKAVDNDRPDEGDTIVYTLQVTNNGPAVASGVVVSDTLPDGVSYVSDDGGGAYDDTTGAWGVGGLEVNSSATLHITATVGAGTLGTPPIINTAVISSSDQPDPFFSNDTGSATIEVEGYQIFLPLVLRNG
jgi:uncharacterized repeat protein (TIGR01451 family)